MTPPTPTEADKRAAKEIMCSYGESDPPLQFKLEYFAAFIAEAMAEEREALRLAKVYVERFQWRVVAHGSGLECPECRKDNYDGHAEGCGIKKALAAIEKVGG